MVRCLRVSNPTDDEGSTTPVESCGAASSVWSGRKARANSRRMAPLDFPPLEAHFYQTPAGTRGGELWQIGVPRRSVCCMHCAYASMGRSREEETDEGIRAAFPRPVPSEKPRAFKIRRALWSSLLLVAASVIAGLVIGKALAYLLGHTTGKAPIVLQLTGAMLLLWGTLFVRGWDIQSYGGATLTERVNRWLYRGLYCIGTTAVVASLSIV